MTAYFWEAKSVETVAEDVLRNNHYDISGEEYLFLFRSDMPRSKGKPKLGDVKVLSGETSALVDIKHGITFEDVQENGNPQIFRICVSYTLWQMLETEEREALVDYLLCHCRVMANDNDNVKYSVASPDVSYFSNNKDRYGDWQKKLRNANTTTGLEDNDGEEISP